MISSTKTTATIATAAAAAMLLLVFAPLTQGTHATYGNYGTQVGWNDSDFAGRFTVISAATMHIARVDAGSAGITDDTYYLHFGSSSDTQTGATDIILTGSSKGTFAASGITFTAVDTDNFETDIKYYEYDGKPGYSPGDFLYFSDDGTLAVESSGFADIRLVTQAAISPSAVTITAGDIITSSAQTDVTEGADTDGILPDGGNTLTTSPSATFVVKYGDKNGNGQRDTSDPHIISAGSSTEQLFYVVGDTYIATAGEGSYGTRVTSSTAKEIPLLTDLTASAYLAGSSSESTIADRSLWVHFADPDGTQDDILYGDIVIKKGTGTAAGSFATRVTSTSQGLGDTISCGASTTVASQLFYLNIDDYAGYSDGDALYLNRPSTCFGGTSDSLALTANDVRMSTVPGTSYAAGSVVATGDSDLQVHGASSANPVTGTWHVVQYNDDRANAIHLTALTNGKIRDADSDTYWTSGEAIYIDVDSSATVTVGDYRIFHASETDSTMDSRATVATGNSDLTQAIIAPVTTQASGKIPRGLYVTGGDGTWDVGKSEYIYLSTDAFVNNLDICAIADNTCTQGSAVTNAGADVTFNGLSSSSTDRYFFSWCRTSTAVTCSSSTPPLILHSDDVEFVSGATRVSPTGADHAPYLQLLTEDTSTQVLARWNKGDTGVLIDDVFYLAVSPGASPTTLTNDDLRITGFDTTRPAGKAVASSSETGAADADVTHSGVVFRTLINYLDSDTNSAYDVGDFVVLDLPTAMGGGNAGTYGTGDLRLTPAGGSAGATTFPAGTIRKVADADNVYTSFGSTGSDAFHIYWYDENRDGSFNAEDNGHDRAYIMLNTGASESQSSVITPLINAVRLVGPGGATDPTGTNTITSATTTSSVVTTTSPTTTTSSVTTTTTTTTATTATNVTTNTTTRTSGTTTTTGNGTTTTGSPAGPTPGFDGITAAFAVVGAIGVLVLRRRRN